MMKRYFIISTLAVMAGLFASCEKEQKNEGGTTVEDVTVYLTTGNAVADEVYYTINSSKLTGKEEVTGSNEISLKLAALKEVAGAVKGTVKADLTKVPSGWTAMPEGAFKFDNASSEIAAGAKEGASSFKITLDATKMPEAGQYALPVVLEISGEHAVLSTTSNTVLVKFVRTIETGGISDDWNRISSDRFTVAPYEFAAGFDYTESGLGVASAFDNDVTTGWYSAVYDYSSSSWASDNSYWYGCFAEVVFNEPVSLSGLVLSANPDDSYNNYYRTRRLSIMFKYEGDDGYTWDKPYSDGYLTDDDGNHILDEDGNYVVDEENGDEAYFTFCPMLGEDIEMIPGYKPSVADFMITDHDYSTFQIDLTEKLAGRKVVSMIIAPAALYGGRQYLLDEDGNYVLDEDGNYIFNYDEEKQDFIYEYYYDMVYGAYVNEITLFE